MLVVGAGTRPDPDEDAPVGNGRAIAVLAAREGATVACADIDGDAAAETARRVRAEGADAIELTGDVSDAERLRTHRRRSHRRHGWPRRGGAQRRYRGRGLARQDIDRRVGPRLRRQHPSALPRVPGRDASPVRRQCHRVHRIGCRLTAGQPLPRLRLVEGRIGWDSVAMSRSKVPVGASAPTSWLLASSTPRSADSPPGVVPGGPRRRSPSGGRARHGK